MSAQGTYLILRRDDAKQLQAAADEEAMRQFVTRWRQSKAYRDSGLVLDCGDYWDPIHRCLAEGSLDPTAGDFPLNHVVLGGKQLCGGGGFRAVLVRPDIVPHVAEAARDIKRSELHARYFQLDAAGCGRQLSEKDFDRLWGFFRQIQQLFDDAAADRAAVLFTAVA